MNDKEAPRFEAGVVNTTPPLSVADVRLVVRRVSSGSIVSDYGLDDRAIGVRFRRGQRIFPLASVSRPALGPTQPPV
jgi:hypothetical protein